MRLLKAAPLVEGAGAVETTGVKLMRPEVFMEFLRDVPRLLGVDQSSIDRMDNVEFRCRLVYLHRVEEDGVVGVIRSHNQMYST